MVRTRIAPSPTGVPHIGNTRTALYDYLFAKHNNGSFIVRIEDTDQKRLIPGAKEAIFAILEWLGLNPDEVYVQSERLDLYKDATDSLIKKGFAKKEEGAVRFIVPKGKTVSWQDGVGEKHIVFNTDDVEDFIILKSDGFPTYHLASVVDDTDMKITHVIRGEEWISSTPKHILLYEALGFTLPVFAHMPVILGPDHQKLSKRHGAKSVLDYRQEGYLKEALLNFMALLGWHPPTKNGEDQEILSMDEMIELFDLKDINTANPIFDTQKLEWMNGVYIRNQQLSSIKQQVLEESPELKNIDSDLLNKLLALAQTRMKTLTDFAPLINPFFSPLDIQLTDKEREVAETLFAALSNISEWNDKAIFATMKKVMNEKQIRMPIIYKIFTGKKEGLPLNQTLAILGKEKTIKQLKKVL